MSLIGCAMLMGNFVLRTKGVIGEVKNFSSRRFNFPSKHNPSLHGFELIFVQKAYQPYYEHS